MNFNIREMLQPPLTQIPFNPKETANYTGKCVCNGILPFALTDR